MIEEIATEIFSLIDAYNKIPADFDFINNNYAIEIKIGESVTDMYYKDDVSLQIRVVGVGEKIVNKKANMYNIIKKATDILELLNKKEFDYKYRIIKENVPFTCYWDEDKFNCILMLNVQKYNE